MVQSKQCRGEDPQAERSGQRQTETRKTSGLVFEAHGWKTHWHGEERRGEERGNGKRKELETFFIVAFSLGC